MKNAKNIMLAYQYLYYVKNTPVVSDREYDRFCKDNNLEGIGGSDRESDYSDETKELAEKLIIFYKIFSQK
jgi:NAD-dependent DNA ligase